MKRANISIIIPVYNAEEYLEECIQSVVNQTISDKEVIFIDDGSTDGSVQIIEKYVGKYEYIKLYRQKNSGAGEARNYGIDVATGRYVSFLDADDFYIDKDSLKKLIAACEKHNVKASVGFRQICDQDGNRTKFELFRDSCTSPEGNLLNYSNYQEDYYYQNYVFDLDLIKQKDIRFPLYRRYQDGPFFVNVMINVKKIWVLPVEFYGYRFSNDTFNRKGNYIVDTLKGLRDNIYTAVNNNLNVLIDRLIDRINCEYYDWLIEKLDDEILEMLIDIKNVIGDSGKNIRILKEIYNYNELRLSHYLFRRILFTKYSDYHIDDYLVDNNCYNIAVYGLGTFGRILINELKDSKVKIVYGIDKNTEQRFDNFVLKILSPEDDFVNCDAVVITPIVESDTIFNNIKQKWNGKIYKFKDILHSIEERTTAKGEE